MTRRLARIQASLERLYDVEIEERVDDFLCDEEVTEALSPDATRRGEALLVAHDADDMSVGLYVDAAALSALEEEGEWLDESRFGAACLATEGVSHFLYLVHRARAGRDVSLLELELQGEVDKYATALLAGNGVGAIRERSRTLRARLFSDPEFLDAADTIEGDRYRLVTRLAGRFAARLERDFVERADLTGLSRALRRFYRVGAREKLEIIG